MYSASFSPRFERDVKACKKKHWNMEMCIRDRPTERVELDFSQVAYIDSTGIGVLVGAAHHAGERGRGFAITHAQPNVVRVAQLLGVDKDIDISAA